MSASVRNLPGAGVCYMQPPSVGCRVLDAGPGCAEPAELLTKAASIRRRILRGIYSKRHMRHSSEREQKGKVYR
jgi:hypothetical protein